MTKDERSRIKYRMKRLAGKFCRRNHVYESFDDSVGELIKRSYLSAYFQCLHENKNRTTELEKEKCELLGIIQGKDKAIAALKKENAQLKEQNANLVAMLKSEREVRVNDDYLRGICELESKVEDWTSEYCELENFMNNKLAEAKEIIKKFSEFVNNEAEYDSEHPQEHTDKWNKLCEQVEQFLSEVKE